MRGQGKTTLAKKVFDNNKDFDYRVWITVSQSYNIEGLLRDMLTNFYKQKGDDPPQSISQMERELLVDEMRNYLQEKRYHVVFDDVWNLHLYKGKVIIVLDIE
jgi:disease resistance protein RPM1